MSKVTRVRLLVALVVLGVVTAVALGLAVVGSPERARLEKLDQARLSDLRRIAHRIDVYWTRNGALPDDLQSISGELGPDLEMQDPETKRPYRYRVVDQNRFELCATFATECRDGGRSCVDWKGLQDARIGPHGAGEQCFELSPVEAH